MRRAVLLLSAALAAAGALAAVCGCREREAPPPAARRPFIVIGIDGAEWRVIRRLWDEGKLPHLKALAERGTSGVLRTEYNASPVIWTTIATGVVPAVHGITDFAVATPRGDVPVSSAVRRVPALWNMVSRVKRRVAVLGWWATWPAERVHGVVVSDRALLDVRRRVSPAGFLSRVERAVATAAREPNPFFGNEASRGQDQLVARLAPELAGEGYDLLLAYFRGVDVVSHNHWKHYEPEAFPPAVRPTATEVAAHGGRVPAEYEAVDAAIGRLLAAARPEPNVLVVSDHGFVPATTEIVSAILDFDALLARLGYLARDAGGGVDFRRTRLYTWNTPDFRRGKRLRFALAGREPGGTVRPEERAAIRARLEADLARITWPGGEPAFQVRSPRGREAAEGIGLVVRVEVEPATRELLLDGDPRPLAGVVRDVTRVSGTHHPRTHGIYIAAGPDVAPGAPEPEGGFSIHDVAPTVLFGLGLPVARDFAGRPWTGLYGEPFRARHPVRRIASWGAAREGAVAASPADAKLLEELGALGYLR